MTKIFDLVWIVKVLANLANKLYIPFGQKIIKDEKNHFIKNKSKEKIGLTLFNWKEKWHFENNFLKRYINMKYINIKSRLCNLFNP